MLEGWKYSPEDSLDLEFAYIFFYPFPSRKSLIRERVKGPKKGNKGRPLRACTSISGAGRQADVRSQTLMSLSLQKESVSEALLRPGKAPQDDLLCAVEHAELGVSEKRGTVSFHLLC